ncbi:hypothetical protein [Pareuzebyella sediminis]|uniref:hypothetical protein n=1 Tax=Pareuzebyella sediminis TaxID=2607998 RepID=UPI0011EFA72A|nr:hypothetical protein [Pareuzebyella sediminis]
MKTIVPPKNPEVLNDKVLATMKRKAKKRNKAFKKYEKMFGNDFDELIRLNNLDEIRELRIIIENVRGKNEQLKNTLKGYAQSKYPSDRISEYSLLHNQCDAEFRSIQRAMSSLRFVSILDETI